MKSYRDFPEDLLVCYLYCILLNDEISGVYTICCIARKLLSPTLYLSYHLLLLYSSLIKRYLKKA
ncbi:hypothetical protein GGS26DRAFT_544154 [Hypomontagnella submonticulosa]|nr:hypothetical protein GGS26DRAFT_544154 [Hypomontagnella submonticulosa]